MIRTTDTTGRAAPAPSPSPDTSAGEAPRPRHGPPNTPPPWAAERWIAAVARIPNAARRRLDALAKVPGLGLVVRFFSSVPLGLLWLALIGLYVAIGSGVSSVRAYFELTDLQFFDAWPMVLLLALMSLTLVVVTVRKIPLTLFKLGVWTVHAGILVLVAGCFLYFSQKLEGLTRIYLHQTTDTYYDATERALYVYRVDKEGKLGPEAMIPLPNLPLYHEHLGKLGNPLDQSLPPSVLAAIGLRDLPVRLRGFYPFAVMRNDAWGPGPASEQVQDRAIALSAGGSESLEDALWLVGTKPAARYYENPGAEFGVEYLYHPSPQRVRDLATPFQAEAAITVRVPALNVEKTYPITPGFPIPVEGTPYTITPREPAPPLPLRSPGYEGAASTGFMLDIVRKDSGGKDFKFTRDALFRFPELSPDFVTDETGKQKRIQERVDHAIDIVYHDATSDQIWVIEPAPPASPATSAKANDTWTVIHRTAGGKVETRQVGFRAPVDFQIADRVPMRFSVVGQTNNAVRVPRPTVIPDRQRPRVNNIAEQLKWSVLELEAGQGHTVYVPFSEFADPKGTRNEDPPVLDVPGVGSLAFVFSTTRRPLPARLTLRQFDFVRQPGARQAVADYVSHVAATDKASGRSDNLKIHLNHPEAHDGLYYFQARWDGHPDATDAERFTVLGVGNRPGVYVMTAGSLLIVLGIVFAFYIKPILLEHKKRQLAAWAHSEASHG